MPLLWRLSPKVTVVRRPINAPLLRPEAHLALNLYQFTRHGFARPMTQFRCRLATVPNGRLRCFPIGKSGIVVAMGSCRCDLPLSLRSDPLTDDNNPPSFCRVTSYGLTFNS